MMYNHDIREIQNMVEEEQVAELRRHTSGGAARNNCIWEIVSDNPFEKKLEIGHTPFFQPQYIPGIYTIVAARD
jgi:hypothetical protein